MMRRNFILKTDSYKLAHWDMQPDGTTGVYSYAEARVGAAHEDILWFGLQYYLMEYLAGQVVTEEDIREAKQLQGWHMPGSRFNDDGWQRVVAVHGGRLPVRIKALPEGVVVPPGTPLMTIENTDPKCSWLTNDIESLLLKVWYPTTVATISWHVKKALRASLVRTGGDPTKADFMLHDFGYRGATSEESAGIGGGAHLVNSKGTDTLEAIRWLRQYYGGQTPGFSVAASEHSIMTAMGESGERQQALRIIARHPNQIVSLVGDSYDYYRFVDWMIDEQEHIERYHVRLVLRPDSVTPTHTTPAGLVRWTLERQASRLASKVTLTSTGHRIVPMPVLWGDGLTPVQIDAVLAAVEEAGFAAENMVFGMGGGLHQKGIDRDTERFALKSSAQERDGEWFDICKRPLDVSKASKAGRLSVISNNAGWQTVREQRRGLWPDMLVPVFEDGMVLRTYTLAEIRALADAPLKFAERAPAA